MDGNSYYGPEKGWANVNISKPVWHEAKYMTRNTNFYY